MMSLNDRTSLTIMIKISLVMVIGYDIDNNDDSDNGINDDNDYDSNGSNLKLFHAESQ
jgi:hypothetical protein